MATSSIKSREVRVVHAIPISKTLPFWEGLKQGKILATKCRGCGKLYFPPVADCPQCLASNMEWVELSGEAIIEAFTQVVVRPATFQHEKPYIVAIGRLKEDVRVLAWLIGFNLSEIRVGMKVRLAAKITPEGNPTYEFTKLE
ncbi:MAG: Zn-ribbon domain-containing OB-fold protein [Candidatus Bathyarchaeia archaeon]